MYNFEYINYNSSNDNSLINAFKKISIDKNNLIIVENNIEKLYYQSMERKLNEPISDIISMEDFKEKIFLTNKYILRETKRILLFFNALTEEQKKILNIRTYFDCIDIANTFYNYYRIFFNDNFKINKNNFSSVQKNKIEIFEEIKINVDKLLEDKFVPIDWIEKEEFLNFSFFKKYKNIIFFDIVKYDFYFKNVIKKLSETINVKFILQINSKDFDENNFRVINIPMVKEYKDINVFVYSSELSVQDYIYKNNTGEFFVSLTDDNSKFINLPQSSFNKGKQFIFSDSMLYKILYSLLNINNDFNKNKSFEVATIAKHIFNPSMMNFYGLTSNDYNFLNKLINEGYKYLDEDIMSNLTTDVLQENINFTVKLKGIFYVAKKINDIKNVEDFNVFLLENIFRNDEDILLLNENYENIFDLLYEIIGIIKSNEDMSFFEGYKVYFKNNTGLNLILLILKYLSNLTLRKQEESYGGIKIKSFYLLKLLSSQPNNINVLGLDTRNLYKFDNTFNFFNEKQKTELGILNYEELKKIEKYRFFQNLSACNKVNLYTYKNTDENIDMPDLINNFVGNKHLNISNINYNYLSYIYCNKYYKNSHYDKYETNYENKFINENISKTSADFKEKDLYIGAYDYINIKGCELKFIYNKIANIEEHFDDENIGFMSKVLGSILHTSMENLIKKFYKNFISDTSTLNLDSKDISDELTKEFNKNYFKIDNFMKKYVESIIIPKFTKNIKRFFNETYKELANEKLIKFYSEKSKNKKEYLIKDIVNIILTGRIDLLIETEKIKKIIDFKSGKLDEDQLNFYNFLLFGNETTAIRSFCNLWDYENKPMKNNNQNFSEEIKNILSKMIKNDFYRLADKNQICMSCSFKRICPKEVIKVV